MVIRPVIKFNLYDFFSVLFPGAITISMLFPFAPEGFSLQPLVLIAALLLAGYIVGQVLHTLSVALIESVDGVTHRDQFVTELKGNGDLPKDAAVSFMLRCQEAFNLEDSESLSYDPQNQITQPADCGEYYELVRTYINIEGRGRSQTYQALYAFSRSILLGSLIAGLVYVLYLIGLSTEYMAYVNININNIFWYTPYIQSADIPVPYLSIVIFGLVILLSRIFLDAMRRYRNLFASYMISDYLMIHRHKSEDGES
jgi:hypothetical protein